MRQFPGPGRRRRLDVRGRGETILVVEDDAFILEMTTRILRRGGYRVLEAADGREAAALAHRPDVSLVLTDSVMPHMSGRDLADLVSEHRPDLPVLFMSGYSEGLIGPHPIVSDDAAFLEKPFTAEVLLKAVHVALARPVQRGPLSS